MNLRSVVQQGCRGRLFARLKTGEEGAIMWILNWSLKPTGRLPAHFSGVLHRVLRLAAGYKTLAIMFKLGAVWCRFFSVATI
jgi:hypothetical protein